MPGKNGSQVSQTFVCEKLELPTEADGKPEFRVLATLTPSKEKRMPTQFQEWVKANGEDNTTYFAMTKTLKSVRVTTRTERVLEKGE